MVLYVLWSDAKHQNKTFTFKKKFHLSIILILTENFFSIAFKTFVEVENTETWVWNGFVSFPA